MTDAVAVSGPAGVTARQVLVQESLVHAPAILTAEVTSALRGMARRGLLTAGAARTAAVRAAALRARRYPFEPFLTRTWELRDTVTTYDAWYVALAESLDTVLVTTDDRLREASGPACPVLSPEQVLARK